MDIGSAVGREQNGVTDEEIRAVSSFRDSDLFSDSDKTALEYAEEMTKTPVAVPDEFFARLREHFDEEQIIELTASIAYENYRARFNHALDIKSDNLYN
ncbi:MAG: carboxymuconolactone decarboxylase family protein [Pyrinomonadaceae bacterium]|nr:carboxymuconolactone decarboxylase family protein [Pyrinomonadaceae bacterium]